MQSGWRAVKPLHLKNPHSLPKRYFCITHFSFPLLRQMNPVNSQMWFQYRSCSLWGSRGCWAFPSVLLARWLSLAIVEESHCRCGEVPPCRAAASWCWLEVAGEQIMWSSFLLVCSTAGDGATIWTRLTSVPASVVQPFTHPSRPSGAHELTLFGSCTKSQLFHFSFAQPWALLVTLTHSHSYFSRPQNQRGQLGDLGQISMDRTPQGQVFTIRVFPTALWAVFWFAVKERSMYMVLLLDLEPAPAQPGEVPIFAAILSEHWICFSFFWDDSTFSSGLSTQCVIYCSCLKTALDEVHSFFCSSPVRYP